MNTNTPRRLVKLAPQMALVALLLGLFSAFSARSQDVTLTNVSGYRVFAGGGYSGIYSNVQFRATLSGNFSTPINPVTLSISGAPAGLSYSFSTNNFTNSQNPITITLAVTNIAKGVYPLTISVTTNAVSLGNSLVIPLIVGTLWTNNNPAGDVTWANVNNWSAGAPAATDSVLFQDAGWNTNYLGSSLTVDTLAFLRNTSGTNQNLALVSGATLSILGTNSLIANVDSTPGNNKTTTINFFGAGATVLVSNTVASVAINGVSSSGVGTTLVMTNLDTFRSVVSRFGMGDFTTANQGVTGGTTTSSPQGVRVDLAKTNTINASYVGDYTTTNTIFSAVAFANHLDGNNGGTETLNFGIKNNIQADSVIFGQGKAGGSSSIVQFNPLFATTNSSFVLRGTNNTRASLLGVAVDSGTTTNTGNNSRMILSLLGGNVDILVNTIWLGRNRNYSSSPNALARGNLLFSYGVVDANTIRAGYQAYTGEGLCNAQITVGGSNTLATLVVNNDLNLGFTAGDWGGGNASRTFGQVVVATNGIVRAKQISVGTLSTNNTITVQKGGILIVSNTIASSAKGLTTLSLDAAQLTLTAVSGVTNVFLTNLTVVTASKINIASLSGFTSLPATNAIIQYQSASGSSTLGIGSVPPGFNNLRLNDNTASKTIELIISTNTPQVLVWKGPGNTWDHSSFNWVQSTNTSIAAKFTDGDRVIFNDTVGVPTSIVINELVSPSQIGVGISFTNSVNAYTFTTNSATPSGIAAGVLTKYGTAKLQIDGYANVGAQINAGTLAGSGVLGSVVTASGTFFGWSGEVVGSSDISGGATNSGTLTGGLTVSPGGAFTNNGTINSSFGVATNGLLINNSSINNLGNSTVSAGGRLVNSSGNLTGTSLTIGGTFEDQGIGLIKLASGTSSLNILSGATFIPGGSAIATTTVQETSFTDPLTAGSVKLNNGSTTIVKVDPGSLGQLNSKVLCNVIYLGPSQSFVVTNGGGIFITNVGATPFAPGQSFKLFGTVPSDGNFSTGIFSLNTTNTYPIITPASPGFGLAWDLSQVIYNGTISIVTNGLPQIPTNIVASLNGNQLTISWPSDYTGWRLYGQTNSLSSGLGTNWVLIAGSTSTNSITITNTAPCGFYRLGYPYP